MQYRAGESEKSWFRSDRYYHTNEGWWFTTREQSQEGPFISKNEAENELILYIRTIRQSNNMPRSYRTSKIV
ncbi:DUF6316 family protein [Aliikangiella maris]|uniref:DUF6316 family protein n=2 Tax=Aliikangiella maris TaxID=3162458 RepID=A0ABV2BNY9_9GAMM